ncbi:MAG: glycosyltransferase family 39 protein [Chloroflexaceae bacterium]
MRIRRVALHVSSFPLYALLLLFLLLATLYNVVIPLGEGPDEPGHMAYVLFLAREGRLPRQHVAVGPVDVPGEGHQPPLAYLLALPAVAWLPPAEDEFFLSDNPDFLWNSGSEPAAFMRSSQEYWPWRGVVRAWHLTRGVATLLGLVTLVCTWKAAHALVQPDQTTQPARAYLPLLATAFVALNPQFLFTSALVTNDALLTALSAGLFWLAVSPSVVNHRHRWSLLAGGLFGLALLTKQSALLLAPLLLWASWRAGNGNWRATARTVVTWAAVALLLAGWWYARNWQLYGDPFGLGVFRDEFMTQAFNWRSPAAWRAALVQLYASFWARFGWMSLHPPVWVIRVYALIGLVALAGLVLYLSRRLRAGGWRRYSLRTMIESPWVAVILLPLLALAWTVSFALTAGLVAWQGRMLFPALPAIAILLAAGWVWLPRLGIGAGLVGLLALALYLPLGVIRPAYEWRTLPPQQAQARLEQSLSARFAQSWERGVELRGWRLAGIARPGETITVTLTWHALEPIPQDWTVFVHLVDDAGRIVAEDNQRPQGGAFPLPRWTPGDWVEDPHPLTLPADLPPGQYKLRAGLYLPEERGRRQYTRTVTGDPVTDAVTLGVIEVR